VRLRRTLLPLFLAGLLARPGPAAERAVVPSRVPSPTDNPFSDAKADLGRTLFFDPRLSRDGSVSCHSCHALITEDGSVPSGADGLPTAVGVDGLTGPRNTPTVWNTGLRGALFWDGRASSLEAQALGPLVNPVEMAMPDHGAVVLSLEGIAGYRTLFAAAFRRDESAGISIDEVTRALACFQRTLVTPGSPFDRQTLSPAAHRGWETFQRRACISCHGAPTFTGGDPTARFPRRRGARVEALIHLFDLTDDPGREAATGLGADRGRWRVPSLRNVAVTGPWFHNGQVQRLEHAVKVMGMAQLAVELSDEEVADLTAFLESLTGAMPLVVMPELPEP